MKKTLDQMTILVKYATKTRRRKIWI